MPAHRPDLTVSIVNTNNCALVRECLRSLYAQTCEITLQVLVVDNASTDGSAAMVKQVFPQVGLIQNTERRGFGWSHNRALEQGTGRYLMILNEDTTLTPQCFDTLVHFMDAHSDAGACGPRLLNPDGSLQRTANRFPTLAFGIMEALSLNRLFPNNPVHRHNVYAEWDRSTVRAVDAVSGACLLVRRQAIEQVGLLDPNFFIYSEEIDWCLRFARAGWTTYYVPDAQLIHYGGQSTAKRQSARQVATFHQIYWNSFFYYYRKHYGRGAERLLRGLFQMRMFGRRIVGKE